MDCRQPVIPSARISDTSAPTVPPVMASAGRSRQTMKGPCQRVKTYAAWYKTETLCGFCCPRLRPLPCWPEFQPVRRSASPVIWIDPFQARCGNIAMPAQWPVRALQHRPPVQGAEVPLIEVGRGLVARGDGAELIELGEEIFEPCPSNQSCQGFR